MCPGVELDPPIRYNGSARKGKLEKVFEAAARTALKSGDEGRMGELDRLQVRWVYLHRKLRLRGVARSFNFFVLSTSVTIGKKKR